MNTPELVSIILPCFNAEEFVSEAVRSALEQSWEHIELVVVDDGSTDSSRAILRKLKEQYAFTLLEQENAGASAARNAGLQVSSGSYIQFLDADDILDPDKIQQQMNLLTHTEKNSIAFGPWGKFREKFSDALFTREPSWQSLTPIDWLCCSWNGGGMMQPGSWLCPRSCIEKAGPWNEELGLNDDGEYFTRVLLQAEMLHFVENAKIYYRIVPSSLSSKRDKKAIQSAYHSLDLSAQHLLSYENSAKTRQAAANVYQRFAYTYFPQERSLCAKAEQKAREFGGATIEATGSSSFHVLKKFFGWKFARAIEYFWRKLQGTL